VTPGADAPPDPDAAPDEDDDEPHPTTTSPDTTKATVRALNNSLG
jgi:hypothetical protein